MIFVWTWLPGYESTAPVASIMGPREQRVPSGSTITLRCVILSPYQTRPIRGVQWLRDNKLLTFQVMQPQLDTRGRRNEISVWRPGIGRIGKEKKRGAHISSRPTRRDMSHMAPTVSSDIFVCVVACIGCFFRAIHNGWKLIDLASRRGFARLRAIISPGWYARPLKHRSKARQSSLMIFFFTLFIAYYKEPFVFRRRKMLHEI